MVSDPIVINIQTNAIIYTINLSHDGEKHFRIEFKIAFQFQLNSHLLEF